MLEQYSLINLCMSIRNLSDIFHSLIYRYIYLCVGIAGQCSGSSETLRN